MSQVAYNHNYTGHFSPCRCSVMSGSLWPHGLQHTRLPCLSSPPRICSNSWLSQWCYPTISSSVISFSSCPQSFLVSGSEFPVSRLFILGGKNILRLPEIILYISLAFSQVIFSLIFSFFKPSINPSTHCLSYWEHGSNQMGICTVRTHRLSYWICPFISISPLLLGS